MARSRTARLFAAAAALPLAVALMGGVASADNGALADDGSNSLVNQQVAAGIGNSNQANNANVSDSGVTDIDQTNVAVNFSELW
jgi:hypothetical protein